MSAPTTVEPKAPAKPVTEAAIWQAIAYATHHNLPAPQSLGLLGTDDRPHLTLYVPTVEGAARWGEWLDLEQPHTEVFGPFVGESGEQRTGFTDFTGGWGGWRWTIRARHEPEDGPSDETPCIAADVAVLATVDGAR